MEDKQNMETIRGFLDKRDAAYRCTEQGAIFFTYIDPDLSSPIECAIAFDGGMVIFKGQKNRNVARPAMPEILMFANVMNDCYIHTMLGISPENIFYARSIIDTNRAEITERDFEDALFDLTFMADVCDKYVAAIENEEMGTFEALNKVNEEISGLFEPCLGEDPKSEKLPETERPFDMTKYFEFCDALESGEDERFREILADDIEFMRLNSDMDVVSGKESVIAKLQKTIVLSAMKQPCFIAKLMPNEKQRCNETPFSEGEVCILQNENPTELWFMTFDSGAGLINGIYTDDSTGYFWKKIV